MKKLLFIFIGICAYIISSSQIVSSTKDVLNEASSVKYQLALRSKKADKIIYAGSAITGVGLIATGIGVSTYLTESEKIKDGDVYSGQIPAILDNQMQMNKTIPAALLASSGIVLAATGATIIVKGVMKKNDVEFALKTFGQTGTGMGVTINF